MVTSEACSLANISKALGFGSLGSEPAAGIGENHWVIKKTPLSRRLFFFLKLGHLQCLAQNEALSLSLSLWVLQKYHFTSVLLKTEHIRSVLLSGIMLSLLGRNVLASPFF